MHVTQSVVEWLCGDYEVEVGHGANRSEYLYKHNITTYLIKDNQPRMKVIIMQYETTGSLGGSNPSYLPSKSPIGLPQN